MTMNPEVTVIIVNWNTRGLLSACLRSLYAETSASMQVVVVDNASTDGSAAMVEAEFPQVDLLANSGNPGFAKANNQGLVLAKGRFVLYLNPDTVILDGAVDRMLRFMDEHPQIGVLGPHTYNGDGRTTQETVIFKPTLRRLFHTHVPLWRIVPGWNPEQAGAVKWHKTGPVEVVKGCCMMIPAPLVYELGGMSERQFMYGEEDDLCERVRQRGLEVWYYQGASIIHFGGEATKQNSEAMVKASLAAYEEVFRRHNPGKGVLLFRVLLFAGSLWRWLAWAVMGLVPAKREIARFRRGEHVSTMKTLLP